MSDTAEGPGWWIASDGRWYPPELHPDTAAPPPSPLPSLFSSGPAGGQAMPTPPATPAPPGFTPPGPLPAVVVYPERGARPTAAPVATQSSAAQPVARRKGRSKWPTVLIVVGLLAGAAGGITALVLSLKTAPTFSNASGVATDFVEVGAAQSYGRMTSDVEPSQRGSFDAQSESDKLFGVAELGGEPYVTTAGDAVQGNDSIINVVACFNPGGETSCVPNVSSELTLRIPAAEVGGNWYVDASQLAALNPNPQVVPPSGIIPSRANVTFRGRRWARDARPRGKGGGQRRRCSLRQTPDPSRRPRLARGVVRVRR